MHGRGAVVFDGAEAQRHARRLRLNAKRGSVAPLSIAGVSVPFEDETKHFKFMGTTGAGKSTAMRELLDGALKRGDRAVIADPDGALLSRFYDRDRGDVILNPFDARSAKWDLFAELKNPYDIDQMARAFIPDRGNADPIINLKPEHVEAWLSPGNRSTAELQSMLSDRAIPLFQHEILRAA